MGTVYQAQDRLTTQPVALKQLRLPSNVTDDIAFQIYLAMTREFEVLSTLRHPYIVSVLDYGFDADTRPFFTMQWLENTQTFFVAGKDRDPKGKLNILLQLLEALVYLHRQSVIHRDLKPDNVMVIDGKVKVLDFGLALQETEDISDEQMSAGTMAYMAPELLMGRLPSHQSDLYAVGMMAYELFAGHHPFNPANNPSLLQDIMTTDPDISKMGVSGGMTQVIEQLLAKEPQNRPATAYEAIQALCNAANYPIPSETKEIRASYLQMARFVGRQAEYDQLLDAVDDVAEGHGAVWLIGGESGVGKTRLINELRIQALVADFIVLHGQAVQDDAPYQLWLDIFRWLTLTDKITLDEASVLKPHVADIESLIGQAVPDAPSLEPEMAQNRLFRVVVDLLQRQQRPLLLLLEDLHWSDSSSLALLRRLSQITEQRPLLIISNYRNDERPDLPKSLPDTNHMVLDRLNTKAIADLSIAMLGQAGHDPQLQQILLRETEGNPFFLVEVMSALAEHAGRLKQINAQTVPQKIVAGGIDEIIRRRLSRIPTDDLPLLKLAATIGRQVDLKLLYQLQPDVILDNWLGTCANAAVLAVQNERWQFSHDKLRTGILDVVDGVQRPLLHQKVAQAIEAVYFENSDHVAALAYHWRHAQDEAKERHYSILVGQQSFANGASKEAVSYFSRALELTNADDLDGQYQILLQREQAYDLQGARTAQKTDLDRLQAIAEQLADLRRQAEIALRQANYAESIGDFQQSFLSAETAVALAQSIDAADLVASGWQVQGWALMRLAKYDEAREYSEKALEQAQNIHNQEMIAQTLLNLGVIVMMRAQYTEAKAYFEQASRIFHEIGDQLRENHCMIGLGFLSVDIANYEEAKSYFESALTLTHKLGDLRQESILLDNLGSVYVNQKMYKLARDFHQKSNLIADRIHDSGQYATTLLNLGDDSWLQGDYTKAESYSYQALTAFDRLGHQLGKCVCLNNLGAVKIDLSLYDEAPAFLEKSLEISQSIGAKTVEGWILNNFGIAYWGKGDLAEAQIHYEKALALRRELEMPHYIVEDLAGLAQIHWANHEKAQTSAYIEEILAYLAEKPEVDGAQRPFRVHLICYQLLHEASDPRAFSVLERACQLLLSYTEHMDVDEKYMFLENVPAHRELMAAWQPN